MAAAADGELMAREQEALDRHLAGCASCQREMAGTAALLQALDGLIPEAPVSMAFEQATLHRVRQAADEPAVIRPWWWTAPGVVGLALAATVVLVLSVALLRNLSELPTRVAHEGAKARDARVARAPEASKAGPAPVAVAARPIPRRLAAELPQDPPAALAAAPDLFMELPILRHMEKLEHFDAIRTTTLDQPPATDGHDDEQG